MKLNFEKLKKAGLHCEVKQEGLEIYGNGEMMDYVRSLVDQADLQSDDAKDVMMMGTMRAIERAVLVDVVEV